MDDQDETPFERYLALATTTCAVLPCRTGQALFIRPGAMVHVGLLTRLTLGTLKNFARHGELTPQGGRPKLTASKAGKPTCISFAEKKPHLKNNQNESKQAALRRNV